MPILNINTNQIGLVGVTPNIVQIATNDPEATVLTTGYLNHVVQSGTSFPMPCLAEVSTVASAGAQPQVGWYQVSHSGTNWSLVPSGNPGDVTLPTIANHIATFTNTTGTLSEDPATAISGGNIQAGLSGTAGYFASFPGTAAKGSLRLTAVANTGDTLVTISNAAHGQASVYSIPDSGAATANLLISTQSGTQHITGGAFQVDAGAISSGLATGGFVGLVTAYPTTTASGFVALRGAVNGSGNFGTTISNATTQAQAQVVTIPNSGAATANFVLDTGTAATGTFNKLSVGATPLPLVDPGSCTITAVAGAANTSTITIQLKDGSGTNIAQSIYFRVYSSSASNGLTLQSAASTGYSVASGGLSLANGNAVTTQISAMSSATGGCVLSLLDTGKQTSYLVLVLPNGNKISAQLSAGSYG